MTGSLKTHEGDNPTGHLQVAADGAGIDSCAVRWYLRYSLSLRDVEELLTERGLAADHTLSRYYPSEVDVQIPVIEA